MNRPKLLTCIYVLVSFVAVSFSGYQYNLPMGVGMVKPKIIAKTTLYFYNSVPPENKTQTAKPVDSLVFVQGKYSVDINKSPSWFSPELIKLDYDMLLLRAVTISRNWIEVIVNNKNGKTYWVEREAVAFEDWQSFILGVPAVEVIDPVKNPMRMKPMDLAPTTGSVKERSLLPLAIKGEWMQVSTSEPGDDIVPSGWIRWKKGEQLLVRYSALS